MISRTRKIEYDAWFDQAMSIFNLCDVSKKKTLDFVSLTEEFLIAADVTRYSNPLDRALIALEPAADSEGKKEEKKAEKEAAKEEAKDEIAADLNAYTSPMRTFDHMVARKEPWEEEEEESHSAPTAESKGH